MKRNGMALLASGAAALVWISVCLGDVTAAEAPGAGTGTKCCGADSNGKPCCAAACQAPCCPGSNATRGCSKGAQAACNPGKGEGVTKTAKQECGTAKGKGPCCAGAATAPGCSTGAPAGCGSEKAGGVQASCGLNGKQGAARTAEAGQQQATSDRLAQATARLKQIGYTDRDIAALPSDAILASAGAGNVVAFAELQPGQTVVDLGCGGGIDCFLAAAKVGSHGKVIGVDMSPQAIAAARANLRQRGWSHVEFRQGRLENLPLEDASVDVAISNCVGIVMRGDATVLAQAARVLKPDGRLVTTGRMKPEYVARLRAAGFADVKAFGKNIIVATRAR